jgi:hypothetical protein
MYENVCIFTVDMGPKKEVQLFTRISRAFTLLTMSFRKHRQSQERGQPTGAQASEEGQAELQLQPVAQELQPVEEVSKDDGSSDSSDEELQSTEGTNGDSDEELTSTEESDEDVWSVLTGSLEKVDEKHGEHKTEQAPPEAEEGTSSHLARVDIISYSQL